MQASFSEITLAELPLVIFDLARNQGDYYQATRGGGHGDYRHIVLAPADVPEAVRLIQLAFHLADEWRNPVLFMGDYYLKTTPAQAEEAFWQYLRVDVMYPQDRNEHAKALYHLWKLFDTVKGSKARAEQCYDKLTDKVYAGTDFNRKALTEKPRTP